MRAADSARLRILLGAGLWSSGIIAAAAATSLLWLRDHLEARNAAMLERHLAELASAATVDSTGRLRLRADLSETRFRTPESGLGWTILLASGPIHASPSLAGRALPISPRPHPAPWRLTVGGREFVAADRVVPLAGGRDSMRLMVAADAVVLDGEDRFLRSPVVPILWPIAAGLLLLGATLVHRGLRPFENLRVRLAAVRRGATGRLEGRYPREIQPLVDDLNGLLDHNEQAIRRAATHTSSLAHALKTPLAVLANEASRLAHVSGDAAAAAAIDQRATELRQHIDAHLVRAGASASGQGLGARCDVPATIEGLVRTMERLHPRFAGRIEATVAPVAFRGERRDLEEILGNLLDNACKWAKEHVALAATREDDRLRVTIDDDGPGLVAAAREAVLRRGVRLDDNVPGAGFGLSIARDLAETYGGTVGLEPSPWGGLRASVRLPRAE